MKQYTTIEQTAKLMELGFKKPNEIFLTHFDSPNDFKSTNVIEINEYGDEIVLENYSIGELLSFLPRVISNKKFDYATINIFHDTINWVVGYVDRNDIMRFITSDIELIDALCTVCRKIKAEGVI